jgi:hypothetical protein
LKNGKTAAINVPVLEMFIETEAWNPLGAGRWAAGGVCVVKWRQ